eukprot:TRINITY_DN20145_c0_g1_i2.p2 TRINITY_DN20145_c0_g1~~TRINITY_DN20145_c0_g1_i2.p2  ORF type:complete len:113 (-),score=11.91 TRINITY_DN20145_c0_g1_i2:246-584(-)
MCIRDSSAAKQIAAHDLEPSGVHSDHDQDEPEPPRPSPRREWAKSARARQKAQENTGASSLTCRRCGSTFAVMCHKDDADVARFKAKQIGHEQGCDCYKEDNDDGCCSCLIA